MNSTKAQLLAILTVLIVLLYPQVSQASEFTAADLMKWDQQGRYSYYSISIEMMGAVLSHGKSKYPTCISDWYYSNGEVSPSSRTELENVMKRFPNHDPRGIIIAWVKKVCGEFPKISD